MTYKRLTTSTLRQQSHGRWLEIFQCLCPGMFDDAIESLGQHVTCPFHGGEKDFRFVKRSTYSGRGNTADEGVAMCTCGVFNDGFAVLQRATGLPFVEVLKLIDGHLNSGRNSTIAPPKFVKAVSVCTAEEDAARDKETLERVANLWAAGKPLDLGKTPYYCERGLDPRTLENLRDVKSMASLGYYSQENNKTVKTGSYPALLAAMRDVNGNLVAVHRTFLSKDASEKAPVASAKKLSVTPGVRGAAIRLFNATGSDVLGLTEGIETALAVRQLAEGAYWPRLGSIPIWACFAERNIRTFQIPADLLDTLRKIIVFADNDENNKGLEAATAFKERMLLDYPNIEVEIKLPPVVGWDWLDFLVNL